MRKISVTLIFMCLLIGVAQAQQGYLITKNSAGGVRLGMTVAEARRALAGFKLSRTSDGDGAALIEVRKNGRIVMVLFAGENDPAAKIDEKAKVEMISVRDEKYVTADGIRPGMSVKRAERLLGKVERIFMSEIEAREFVVFRERPKGLMFRADVGLAEDGTAGVYPPQRRETTRYSSTAYICFIQISDYLSD